MKKLSISLLVMLLIASLFTSCSMGSDDASDVRVKVRLTPSGGGRSLTTDIETINLDDDSITWHYSATKVSETQFNYGATSDSILPKDGIVTLSQGEWNIELRGFKDGKKVYTGTTNNVTIKWNFYEPNVTVPVPVKQNTGDNGFIVINNVTIPNGNSNVPPNYISIDRTEIIKFKEPYLRLECTPGSHTITFAYKDGNDVIASKSLVVTVISGRETAISGKIDKNETSTGVSVPTSETKPIEVKQNEATTVSVSVAPVQPSSSTEPQNKTTVIFPAGSFNADSANAVLNLSVKSAGEFSVTSPSEPDPVASIDISLKVNEQSITSFNNEYVEITTYILAGLENVQVKYTGEGDQPILVSYNSRTGELVFKTNHFSEYIVVANVEALNVSTGIPYTKLVTAIEEVENEQIVKLLSNVSVDSIDIPNKNFTIDLNSKAITTNYGLNLIGSDNTYLLSVKNGTLKSLKRYAFLMYQSSGLIIDNMNVEAAYGGVYLSKNNNNMSVSVINDSKINAAVYGIATNASEEVSNNIYIEVKDSIVETSSEDQDNTGILFNVKGRVHIENSTIKGNRQGMILRGGTDSVIKNSTIEATGTKTSGYDWSEDKGNWGQGNQVPLASLVVGNHSNTSSTSYAYPVSVTLDNAEIISSENRSGIHVYKANNDVSVTGTIVGNTTINGDMNRATCNIAGNIAFDVYSNNDFSAALKNKEVNNIIVNLKSDVTYDITPWISGTGTMGGNNTNSITINGNKHKITFNNTNNDWNGIYIANENATLTINNATITNSGYNDSPWNRHDINFHCKVVLDTVTSDKAIAVAKDSSLNNVKISDNSKTDDYLLWIQALGQEVNVIKCELTNNKTTGTTRGIAIKDEYIGSPTRVKLNVSGTKFVTTKKAAVLVTSTAGADIVWGEGNDITGVEADTTNAVWNDNARTAAWNLVTVSGCTKFQEK